MNGHRAGDRNEVPVREQSDHTPPYARSLSALHHFFCNDRWIGSPDAATWSLSTATRSSTSRSVVAYSASGRFVLADDDGHSLPRRRARRSSARRGPRRRDLHLLISGSRNQASGWRSVTSARRASANVAWQDVVPITAVCGTQSFTLRPLEGDVSAVYPGAWHAELSDADLFDAQLTSGQWPDGHRARLRHEPPRHP
jgi:hypothetical protein